MVLPLPCEPVAPAITAPAHGLLHEVRHALPHIHRHTLHAVHHAGRAALRHAKLIAGAGCRAAPLLIASNILAVPLPAGAPPATTVQPVTATQPVQPDPYPPQLPLPVGFGPGFAYEPVRNVLPANEVARLALADPLSNVPVSVPDPTDPATDLTDLADPGVDKPRGDPVAVPEPSSLAILAGALAACPLLRWRPTRAAQSNISLTGLRSDLRLMKLTAK